MAKPVIDYGQEEAANLRQNRIRNNEGLEIAGPDFFVPEYRQAVSDDFAMNTFGFNSGDYAQMVGNSINLPDGIWMVHGYAVLSWGGGSFPTWSTFSGGWYSANGDNSPTTPAINFTYLSPRLGFTVFHDNSYAKVMTKPVMPIRIDARSAPVDIYLCVSSAFAAANLGLFNVHIYAEKVARR